MIPWLAGRSVGRSIRGINLRLADEDVSEGDTPWPKLISPFVTESHPVLPQLMSEYRDTIYNTPSFSLSLCVVIVGG